MSYKSIKLSNKATSLVIAENAIDYVLDEDGLDLGEVKANHNMTQYIDLVGKHLDMTVLQPRDISITGYIIGKTEREIMGRKIKLNRLINPFQEVRLEYLGYFLQFKPDSSIKYGKSYKENNEVLCKFQILGTCAMPLFRLNTYNTYRQTVSQKKALKFPGQIKASQGGMVFSYLPFESLRYMPNFGDVESGFTMKFVISGNVVKPYLKKLSDKSILGVDDTLIAGDELIFCTELGSQNVTLIRNGVETNYMSKLIDGSDIAMSLNLGINQFEIKTTSGEANLNAQIIFSPRFLEVEGR